MAGDLDADAVDRVLERAIELDEDPITHPTIEADALAAAAEEVGISGRSVRRSVAIERLGPVPQQNRLDRLLGPSMVVVEREVPFRADEAFDRLDEWLTRGHRLRRIRRDGFLGEWRKRTDMAAALSRAARGFSGRAELGTVRALHAHVVTVDDDGWSMVRVTVVRRAARNASAGVSGGAGAVSVGVTAAAVVTTGPLALLAAPIAAVGGVTAVASKRSAVRLERDLTRLLDQLHDGRTPGRRRRRRR